MDGVRGDLHIGDEVIVLGRKWRVVHISYCENVKYKPEKIVEFTVERIEE